MIWQRLYKKTLIVPFSTNGTSRPDSKLLCKFLIAFPKLSSKGPIGCLRWVMRYLEGIPSIGAARAETKFRGRIPFIVSPWRTPRKCQVIASFDKSPKSKPFRAVHFGLARMMRCFVLRPVNPFDSFFFSLSIKS